MAKVTEIEKKETELEAACILMRNQGMQMTVKELEAACILIRKKREKGQKAVQWLQGIITERQTKEEVWVARVLMHLSQGTRECA